MILSKFLFKPLSLLMIFGPVILVSSCLSREQKHSYGASAYLDYVERHSLQKIDKITSFRYQGWHKLDEMHLMISAAYNKRFFIRLKSPCPHLKTSKSIIVRNSTSNTFSARFDSISPGKFPGLKCFVKDIYPVTQGQADDINALDTKARAVNGDLPVSS